MIAHDRLRQQRLSATTFTKPEAVVAWMGAVQAQDYAGAKWALGLRMRNATDASIERACAAGQILRTHVMRPTWHFVAPADIRWMLALTAPRVRAQMAPYDRRLGLDAAVYRRSHKTLRVALRGGVQLTRQELRPILERAGVRADGVLRLSHLMMRAELDAVICSGARRGKQFTYALLDDRVPSNREWSRDDALAELTRRYFTSHGPAQLRDFSWWSGLTIADAQAGIEMVGRHLGHEVIAGRAYWFAPARRATAPSLVAHLLPFYDEFLVAYKDRSASFDPGRWTLVAAHNPLSSSLIVDGQVVGGWTRALTKGTVTIALDLCAPLNRAGTRAIADAAQRYGAFLGLDVVLK